ncbi:MAG TPA: glyoxalase superfamily protein [Planctomycetota bacterium]
MESRSWRIAPILGVARVRPAAEYYRDVLGFRLDPERGVFQPVADEPDGVYAIVERDGASVHLQIRRGERAARPAQRGAFERDVYVYVDDIDALHADLVRRGAKVQPPRRAPYGIRECEVEDLDGHRLAFGEIEG